MDLWYQNSVAVGPENDVLFPISKSLSLLFWLGKDWIQHQLRTAKRSIPPRRHVWEWVRKEGNKGSNDPGVERGLATAPVIPSLLSDVLAPLPEGSFSYPLVSIS